MHNIKKSALRKTTMYLIVIAILLDSTTMYKYLKSSPLFGAGFGWLLGLLCILYFFQASRFRITNTLKNSIPVIIMLLAYVIINSYNFEQYLISFVGSFLFLFIFSYVLYQKGEMSVFLQVFSNVIVVIAVISIFFWLFGSILSILPGRTQLRYFWAEKTRITYSYYYLYFENRTQNLSHGSMCNVGVFTEAPGYSGFLAYALLIEIVMQKLNKKEKRKTTIRIIILIATLFTTQSTKGIIVVLITLAIEYITRKEKNMMKKALKVVGSFVMIVFVIYISFALTNRKMDSNSGLIRLDDFRAGIQTFIENPLFGAGYNNKNAIIKHQLVARGNSGLSMGLSTLLAYGGLWLFSIYCGAAVVSYKSCFFAANKKQWYLVIAVLLYNLIISNSGFSIPYIFAIAAAYAAPKTASHRSRRQDATKSKKELLI